MVISNMFAVALLLVTLCLHTSGVVGSGDAFTWADCGIQLTKDIQYVSASISPLIVGTSGPLSINVQASITSKVYNSDTQLVVYKDGELYLDVQIQDLCTIISSSTKSLSCPLNVGPVSFTYTFDSLPVLPVGHYDFLIKNGDLGCLQLSGRAGSLIGSNNFQTSSFVVTLAGDATFQGTPSQRTVGSTVAVTTGTFKSALIASTDLGGTVDLSAYNWQLNGAVIAPPIVNNSVLTLIYGGTIQVYSAAETLMSGTFNWTYTYDQTSSREQVTGKISPVPVYSFSDNFTYPIILGNLGPFTMLRTDADTKVYVVSGERRWCTAGVDECNVCGGDGSTCKFTSVVPVQRMSDKEVAIIVVGVVGGVLGIVGVVVLAILLRRTKRRQARYHDADLIDHPQKPDYGTMAIDDIMREGERAAY